MPNPLDVIEKISKILNNKGTCIIRTPIVNSYSWEFYKEDWVQLDAPRHLIIHSLKSLKLITEKYNMRISNYIYDSTSFQFWGSEQYLKKIPLNSSKSYLINPLKSIFSNNEINKFEKKAKNLNNKKRGDQAVFYIKKNK